MVNYEVLEYKLRFYGRSQSTEDKDRRAELLLGGAYPTNQSARSSAASFSTRRISRRQSKTGSMPTAAPKGICL